MKEGNPNPWTAASTAELQQGRNIIAAAFQSLDTLKHLVFSSLPSPGSISNGKFNESLHFEAKATVERTLRDNKPLAEKTTVVWAGYYMENLSRWEMSSYIQPVGASAALYLELDDLSSSERCADNDMPLQSSKKGEYILSTPSHPKTPLALLATTDDFGKFGKLFKCLRQVMCS